MSQRHQPRDLTSLSLLERVKADEQQAWQRLVDLYTPLVCHWCARWQVTGADADDIVQDVFLAVSASIEKFQRPRLAVGALSEPLSEPRPTESVGSDASSTATGGEATGTFRGWLGAITRNKLRDFYERRQRQPAAQGGSDVHRLLQEIPAATLSDDASDAAQLSDVYHRALELIRGDFQEHTWQAFWQTTVENQSPAEVAAALGMSKVAVRQAKARVLRRLKEEVGDLIH
ncbi:MAG: RNA polymerase sigma factor [Gemmataceae bacterium]